MSEHRKMQGSTTKNELRLLTVYVHGWGGSKLSLAKLETEFAKLIGDDLQDRHLLELPGFGETKLVSEFDLDDYSRYLLSQLLDIVEEVDAHHANELQRNDRLLLIGHSVGGKIILNSLLRLDKLLGHFNSDNAKKLKLLMADAQVVLINASGIASPKTLKQKVLYLIAKIFLPLKLFLLRIDKSFFKFLQKVFYKFFVGARDYEKLTEKPLLRKTFQNVVSQDFVVKDLATVQNQILLIWGELDRATPVWKAEVFKQYLKNSKLVVVPDATHGLPLFQPQLVAKYILNWLKSLK